MKHARYYQPVGCYYLLTPPTEDDPLYTQNYHWYKQSLHPAIASIMAATYPVIRESYWRRVNS